jgi:formylglycine-generating enzyme required for sulfatase activity
LGHNGDESWTDIWKGIIKMPVDASSDNESGRYFEALKVLFERPTQVDQRRPTELMSEADQWVKQRHAEMGAKLRDHLRRQFLAIVNGPDGKEKEIARDLIDLSNFVVLADPQDKRDEFDTGSFRRGEQEVHLSRYLLCKYAVSNEQYWLFDNNFVGRDIQGRAGDFNHSLQPAVKVSWSDAYWYCEFVEIGFKELRLALTTEAQWEYAARSGSTGDYFRNHEGQDVKKQDLADYAQFGQAESEGRTLPVKGHGKDPNAWGLEMMAGNVWEWCSDWYGEYPEDAVLTDPFGPKEGSIRVLRGGCWYYEAALCRSANRFRYVPSSRGHDFGFRVALSSSGIPRSPEADK